MNTFILTTTWGVGMINGYKKDGIAPSIKYGTLGVSLIAAIANSTEIFLKGSMKVSPNIFIRIPVLIGSVYCLGHHFGKAVGSAEG
jgi:hypothetical protein